MGAGYVRALRVGFWPSESLSKGYQNNKNQKSLTKGRVFHVFESEMAKIRKKILKIQKKILKIEENFVKKSL